ncbi:MAG: hypothetical protein QF775_03515, partial [archaeon]|nr:hypothetical protein [archaeon]
MVIVFAGIIGAYQLASKVVFQSQHRIVATALAQEHLEMARNLSYADVGVQGGFPSGFFAATQQITRNGSDYTVVMDVNYVADPADGLVAPADTCINDYKRVLATVSWQGRFPGEASLATDVAPKNDIQECEESGGLLKISVIGALGESIPGADVDVTDVDSALSDVCVSGSDGSCQVLLPASPGGGGENYKIEIGKVGYSGTETFRTGDIYQSQTIATPEDPHATVLDGQIGERTFSIDQVGSMSIQSRTSRGRVEFIDIFENTTKLSESQNVEIVAEKLVLDDAGGSYATSGHAISNTITNSSIVAWHELVFSGFAPVNTEVKVQVLYLEGINWIPIPETDLAGNVLGFT